MVAEEPASKQWKGVLFDLDGTLIDTHDLILSSFRHATRTVLGRVIPDEVLMAKVGIPLDVQMQDFSEDPEEWKVLSATYREYNHAAHDQMVKEFPGVVQMVADLARMGLRLGVVTSKRHALAMRGLKLFGMDEHMELLVGPDDCPAHKPDPLPVLTACEMMGLQPSECIYVGDSPFDIQAGNAAGCATVAVTWGMFPLEVLLEQNPTYVFGDPAQLTALVS